VRIVAALTNPDLPPKADTVTLLNATNQTISLVDWQILDGDKNSMGLSGSIAAGDTVRITLREPVVLPNQGGQITLLNADGLRVDGVIYTRQDASLPGFSLAF
jgi:hypothetical protein